MRSDVAGRIYFAIEGYQDEDTDVVKIGFATNVKSRLHALNTGNHRDLAVPCCFSSCKVAEKMVHLRFAKHHVRREWFRLAEEIEEFWDDIYDYQLYHASGETPDSALQSLHDCFIPLTDLELMLANVGTPWPEIDR